MQPNYFNNSYQNPMANYPQQSPGASAVNINIIAPQAYAGSNNTPPSVVYPQTYTTNPCNNFYSMYGANPNNSMQNYPINYNNMINMPNNSLNAINNGNINVNPNNSLEQNSENVNSASQPEAKTEEKKDDK